MSVVPPTPDMLLGLMRDQLEEGVTENAVAVLGAEHDLLVMPMEGMPPHEVLSLIAVSVRIGALPRPHWAAMVSDTYLLKEPHTSGARPEDYAGRLAELFAAGDGRVTEALMAICWAPDGPSYAVSQPYVHSGEEWHWHVQEPVEMAGIEGRLLPLLQAIVRAGADREARRGGGSQ